MDDCFVGRKLDPHGDEGDFDLYQRLSFQKGLDD
jgi:hypothetical protein